MHTFRITALVIGLAALVNLGCQSALKSENAQLKDANQALQARLADADAKARAADPTQLQAMQNELAQREARIRELEAQLRKPDPGRAADPGIAGIQTSYDRAKGEMTVHLPGDILFASGSADLKPTAKATLNKIAAALKKDYPGKKFRVEGHTDTDPIAATKKHWTDNLDLSQNRAAAVMRYIVQQGVDKKLIGAVGYGDARPKSTKPASRRVEIVVLVG